MSKFIVPKTVKVVTAATREVQARMYQASLTLQMLTLIGRHHSDSPAFQRGYHDARKEHLVCPYAGEKNATRWRAGVVKYRKDLFNMEAA